MVVPAPKDNPALHQGRIRASPHVDGQWASHIYVAIRLGLRSGLYPLIKRALDKARETVPTLRDIWDLHSSSYEAQENELRNSLELHVSLSRPIFMRAHQREEFKQAIRLLAQRSAACVHGLSLLRSSSD
jgi:U6 snRNA phosphodiesterase